jgi:hypothetical protein
MFTETNLDETVGDREIYVEDFIVFRNDRNILNNPLMKKSGGSVLIEVKRHLPSKILEIDGFESLEQICVEISMNKFKVFLICVYFPSNSLSSLVSNTLITLHSLKKLQRMLDLKM